MSNKVVFDFDNTIFDSVSFKHDLFRAIELAGFRTVDVEYAYHNVAPEGIGYGFLEHLSSLVDRCTSDDCLSVARKNGEDVIALSARYVYPNTAALLERLRQTGHYLIILSRGQADWQSIKIRLSGVLDYFEQIVIVRGPKEEALVGLIGNGKNAIVINDNVSEIVDMMKVAPLARYIVFNSSGQSNSTPSDCEVATDMNSLGELLMQ